MRQVIDYPEAAGKIVAKLTISNTKEFRGVEIAFTDKTALLLELSCSLEVDPSLSDWKSGNLKQLKKFPSVKEVA